MSIVRAPRPQANFTVLANSVLRDERLSFRARGILAAILSRPDNWRTSSEQLAKEGLEGRDAIRAAMKELEATGYMRTYKRRDPETGRIATVTVIYDTPHEGTEAASTGDGFSGAGKATGAWFSGAGKSGAFKRTEKEELTPSSPCSKTQVKGVAASTNVEENSKSLHEETLVAVSATKRSAAIVDDIIDEAWEPHRGQSTQSRTKVATVLRTALDNGVAPERLVSAVAGLSRNGEYLSDYSLQKALQGVTGARRSKPSLVLAADRTDHIYEEAL